MTIAACMRPRERLSSSISIAFDHGVGEQLAGTSPRPSASAAGRVGLGELELDHLALAHLADAGEAELRERVADRLALRVEHALLGHDVDARLHRAGSTGNVIGRSGP